jgi:hypothetical protein
MREILKITFFFVAAFGQIMMWKEIIKEIRGNKNDNMY